MVSRLDYGTLNKPQKTGQGFLKAPCFATRSGIFLYRNDDGSVRREFRPPEEVFNPESMQTLQGIPVTDNHPNAMLDSANAPLFSKGFTGDLVEKHEDLIGCNITIIDANLIASIENREKVETSCGYNCDLDETPGEWNGQKYDAIQRKIRYNHLAIVPKGRAGASVRVRMDSAATQINGILEEKTMVKLRIDEVDFDISEDAEKAVIAKFKKDAMSLEEMSAMCETLRAEIESLKGAGAAKEIEMDACKEELKKMDSLKSELELAKNDTTKIHTAAMARLNLIKIAEKQAPQVKLDSLSDKEIKVEVIKAKKPDFKTDGLSDSFIDGLFEGLTQSASKMDAIENAINGTKAPAPTNIDARKASMEADKNAWKTK